MEEHLISLPMVPVVLASNISDASYQKEFVLLFFFFKIYLQQICINLYRNFYQSSSGTCVFSAI